MSELERGQVNMDASREDSITLASILSEYKADAFVRNERRLSKDELEKRAEEIIAEMKRGLEAEPEETAEITESGLSEEVVIPPEPSPEEEEEELRVWTGEKRKPIPASAEPPLPTADGAEETVPSPGEQAAEQPPEAAEAAPEPDPPDSAAAQPAPETQEERRVWQQIDIPAPDGEETAPPEDKPGKRPKRRFRWLRREATVPKPPKPVSEPSPEEAARHYAVRLPSLRLRAAAALLLTALLGLLLLLDTGRDGLPAFLRGDNQILIMMLAQLAVLLLGADVFIRGFAALLVGKPIFETLTAAANVAALFDSVWILLGKASKVGLPYAPAAAAAMAFSLWGSRLRTMALWESFKTMRAARIPTVITAEPGLADEGIVLYKRLGSAKGFIHKCLDEDLPLESSHRAVPILLLAALILSFAAVLLSGTATWLHGLTGMLTAAATLTAPLVFTRPYARIAHRLAGSGAVLAGWKGAAEIHSSVGLLIRDSDLFPEHAIRLGGMKVLSGSPVEKVVSYTGSLILASDSGPKRVFSELMRQYGASLYHVEGFDCETEGGISAFIGTTQVLVGSGAYMNLCGIRVPSSMDVAGAVYTAIDGILSGVFIINYTPGDPVRRAILCLKDTLLRPIYAVRDFNISPASLRAKLDLPEDAVRFLPVETRYRLSTDFESEQVPAALLTREGLIHYTETVRCGRRLYRAVRCGQLLSLSGAALGLLLVFLACARGAFAAASTGRLLLFMLLWLLAESLVTDAADGR